MIFRVLFVSFSNLYEKNEKSMMKVKKVNAPPIVSEISFSRRTFLVIENDDVTKTQNRKLSYKICSRIRERDKKNTEHYVGDY